MDQVAFELSFHLMSLSVVFTQQQGCASCASHLLNAPSWGRLQVIDCLLLLLSQELCLDPPIHLFFLLACESGFDLLLDPRREKVDAALLG